ncbi:MAG: hypothetical protein EBQ63_07655 [Actinobacteria bacterium]|nr:hypothetical protein [Actinomycetota bacterium]
MKFKALLLLFSLLLSQNTALAAPLPTVKNLRTSFAIESDFDVSNAILTKDAVVLVGSKSGTAEISARTFEGVVLWRISLMQSIIATDIKSAADGSFWVLSSSEVFDTSTVASTSGALNPDSIVVTSPSPKSRGLVSLNIGRYQAQDNYLVLSHTLIRQRVFRERSISLLKVFLLLENNKVPPDESARSGFVLLLRVQLHY